MDIKGKTVASEARTLTAEDLFEGALETITRIGTEGYFVMVNQARMTPEFIHCNYPQEWQDEYDVRAYHLRDPIFLWSLTNNGTRRWSEVTLPCPMHSE